ncbi:hypothetical protein BKD30_06125 [Tersicoccus phoenicis]|uniref:Uncharacterized protein n=1 Tax=Tersicoccus phoenicis TaxID=554083 RepID=A0A1R1LD96_9MICC|nr:hypothetical protein [Tersicoccus phoenicis]OMH25466.1 hypothetical protein BKD30_06125 [Tersicoccus phoenicis]
MQIRSEDQPEDTTGARRASGWSPTEPITTTSSDRTASLDRTQAIDRADLDGGAPTQATPTQPVRRSSRAQDAENGGYDYSNWYDSDLYVADDATATRPIDSLDRGGFGRDRSGGGGRGPDDARTQALPRPTDGPDDARTQALPRPTDGPDDARTQALPRPTDGPDDARTQALPRPTDGPDATTPQPISSERASQYQDDQYDDQYQDAEYDEQYPAARAGVDEDRSPYASGDPYRVGIGVKLGLLVLGLLLAVIAAVLLGMNGQAAVGAVRPGGALGAGLLPVLGFGAGVLCLIIILICGRTTSTAQLTGSVIALPALAAMFSGDAAALVRSQLTSWSVPGPVAEAFLRPETALAGVLLFLVGIAFSTRRRAEDLAGPVSSFFLGVFSAICFAPGLLLFCLSTQEQLLRTFAQAGWPAPDATRPVVLVLGVVLMAIGVACTSRAPGGMVVSGVVVLVLGAAAGFAFLAGSGVLPAGAADDVAQNVTATVPLLALLAGVGLIVASFAGLSLGRNSAAFDRT